MNLPLIVIVVFFLMLLVCLSTADASICVINIDASAIRKPASFRASGFLHGMSISEPPQELVEPLKPKLFRILVRDLDFLIHRAYMNVQKLWEQKYTLI